MLQIHFTPLTKYKLQMSSSLFIMYKSLHFVQNHISISSWKLRQSQLHNDVGQYHPIVGIPTARIVSDDDVLPSFASLFAKSLSWPKVTWRAWLKLKIHSVADEIETPILNGSQLFLDAENVRVSNYSSSCSRVTRERTNQNIHVWTSNHPKPIGATGDGLEIAVQVAAHITIQSYFGS